MTAPEFQLVVIRPADFIYVESWREAIDAMRFGFEALGIHAPVVENRIEPGATPIVFGAHHLAAGMEDKLPSDTILYNLEQLQPGYPWHSPRYLAMLARFAVWDFHQRNVDYLRRECASIDVRHVPIGYVPQMANIETGVEDIDVLFYGVVTERRKAVLEALARRGVNVVALRGVFGAERDAWIARAKVVLNMHQQPDGYFEALRVTHLMANGKAVVTECADVAEIDARLAVGLCMVPYDRLAETCAALAEQDDERRALAKAALGAVGHPDLRMSEILRRTLLS